jgi:hypothetical protein
MAVLAAGNAFDLLGTGLGHDSQQRRKVRIRLSRDGSGE